MGNLKVNELEKLIHLGFCFLKDYGPNEKIFVHKKAVFENPAVMEEHSCDSLDEAIEVSNKFLDSPSKLLWSTIVRFNRGLGIEYKNLPDIEAASYEEALEIAKNEADKLKKEPKLIIAEIKVRLKN